MKTTKKRISLIEGQNNKQEPSAIDHSHNNNGRYSLLFHPDRQKKKKNHNIASIWCRRMHRFPIDCNSASVVSLRAAMPCVSICVSVCTVHHWLWTQKPCGDDNAVELELLPRMPTTRIECTYFQRKMCGKMRDKNVIRYFVFVIQAKHTKISLSLSFSPISLASLLHCSKISNTNVDVIEFGFLVHLSSSYFRTIFNFYRRRATFHLLNASSSALLDLERHEREKKLIVWVATNKNAPFADDNYIHRHSAAFLSFFFSSFFYSLRFQATRLQPTFFVRRKKYAHFLHTLCTCECECVCVSVEFTKICWPYAARIGFSVLWRFFLFFFSSLSLIGIVCSLCMRVGWAPIQFYKLLFGYFVISFVHH